MKNFYNAGFGWVCRNCERELKTETAERSRLLTEGEAESKYPELSNIAMAKWADAEKNRLVCPRCETTETVNKE